MTRQNASIAPDFTHVRHIKEAGYYNGNGEVVNTPFTLVTKLDGDNVKYKVAFCSRNEKNYVKKKGVEVALNSEHEFTVPIDEVSFTSINDAVILDLIYNRRDIMPNAHRRWAEIAIENMQADQAERDYFEEMVDEAAQQTMKELGLAEGEMTAHVH